MEWLVPRWYRVGVTWSNNNNASSMYIIIYSNTCTICWLVQFRPRHLFLRTRSTIHFSFSPSPKIKMMWYHFSNVRSTLANASKKSPIGLFSKIRRPSNQNRMTMIMRWMNGCLLATVIQSLSLNGNGKISCGCSNGCVGGDVKAYSPFCFDLVEKGFWNLSAASERSQHHQQSILPMKEGTYCSNGWLNDSVNIWCLGGQSKFLRRHNEPWRRPS